MSDCSRESDDSCCESSIQDITKNRTNDSFSRIYAFDSCEYLSDLEGYIFSFVATFVILGLDPSIQSTYTLRTFCKKSTKTV